MRWVRGFRILGSLEVVDDAGRPVAIGGPRERRLLATLLIDIGHAVSMDRLIDAVWSSEPPSSASKAVRNLVSRINPLISADPAARSIETVGNGYRLRLDGAEYDAARFEALTAEATRSAAAGDTAAAVGLLKAGLALWRGPALSGLAGWVIETAARGWDERRAAAQESYIDLLLGLGRHHEALALLSTLTGENPFRQKFVQQLMAALDASGRQAEALATYRDFRRRLSTEIGIDPSPELDAAQRMILHGSGPKATAAQVDLPQTPVPVQGPAGFHTAVPRQLPAPVRHFVGRSEHLAALDGQFADPSDKLGGTILISAIDGTAGIGKTALAVTWAWRIADRCPAGQLFADLHGFDPVRDPAPPAEVLRGFLDALGVPPNRVPRAFDAQVGLYRSLLAEQRALVVLDNARDAEQVRPLLPGGRSCIVVVTSRRRLTGLIATHDAVPVTVGLLSPQESRDLLIRRLGPERVATDAEAVSQLIEICAGLPLALAIAAAHAADRPRIPLHDLVDRLREESRLLDGFDTDDTATSPRAVFSWSYRSLDSDAARMFRHLSLQPGPDCSLAAAACLAGVPPKLARAQLAELERSNLVTENVAGRFTMHDLLAAFAGEQAAKTESDSEQTDALRRMFEYYLATAQTAGQLLDPTRQLTSEAETEIASHAQASAWFEAEHAVLIAAAERAFDAGLDDYAWQIPWALTTSFDRRGRWDDLARALTVALTAAERSRSSDGQARAYRGLGNCAVQLGDLATAELRFQQARDCYERIGDLAGQAGAELGLSWAAARNQRHEVALDHALRALALHRATGNRAGTANALNAAGWQYAKLAQYDDALKACSEALPILHEAGDRQGAAATSDSLGYARFHRGDHQEAVVHYREAVELRRDLGDRFGLADTLARLGDAHEAGGQREEALTSWREALEILEDLQHPQAHEIRARLNGIADPS